MNAEFDCIYILFNNSFNKVCSSQVEISHTFMEMILNFICFEDFYFIEILLFYFDFFSTLIFSPTPVLKTYTV